MEDAQCKQLAQCGMAVLSLFTGSRHSKVKATRILRANGIELESSIEIG